jgi:hypothetical protein
MNRREMILALAVAPLAAAACGLERDGLPDELRADDYRQYFAADEDVVILLDGRVIKTCVAANRAEGWADVLFFRRDRFSFVQRRYGRVTFRRVPIPNLPEPQGGQQWRA